MSVSVRIKERRDKLGMTQTTARQGGKADSRSDFTV